MRWTLARKVLGLALLNLALLALAMLVFAGAEYRMGPESVLLSPARDRVEAVGVQFADQMNREGASPEVLIMRYSARYDSQFLLVKPDGTPIAGPALALPGSLLERMRHGGPPRPGGKGGKKGPPKGEGREERKVGDLFRDRHLPDPLSAPNEASFFAITTGPLAYWAGVRIPYHPKDAGVALPAVLLIRSEKILSDGLFFDFRVWLGIGSAMLAISALCWMPFLRGLTRSIAVMDRATSQIADGRFDVLIPQDRNDEVGHLGLQISRMSGRLDHYVKSQKRFLGDIAHELSAPMARIQFALGILEQRAGQGEQEHVARLRVEIQEMSSLVNELLSFSRAEVAGGATQRQVTDVASVIARAIEREGIAPEQVLVSAEPGLAVMASEVFLVRGLANVLRNADRYAGQAGPIEICARTQGDKVLIEIADSGPGLDPAFIERIFEPFFRPEADRSRQTGGAGLGLAIVKTCVEACGGTVMCANREPRGLVVRMLLDRAP